MNRINMRRLLDIALARLQKGQIADLDDAAMEAAGGAEAYFDAIIVAAIKSQRKTVITEVREAQGTIAPSEDMLALNLHVPQFVIADGAVIPTRQATVRQFRKDATERLRHDRRRIVADEEQVRTGKLLSEAVDGNEDALVSEAIRKHAELMKAEAERTLDVDGDDKDAEE